MRAQYARLIAISIAVGVLGVAAALTLHRTSGDASSEDAALAMARKQRGSGDRSAALGTLSLCALRNPKACRCADETEELAVDLGRYADALAPLERARCDESARHRGGRAEALVGMGRTAEGLREAATALAMDASEPHASFAKAWGSSMSGSAVEALAAARKAVAGGRGVPALLLLGLLAARTGDARGAHDAIDEAARLAPDDPRVAYDLGVVAQGEGRYRDAREAYLRALSLDPKLADARYNLAVLTHGAGADEEARHHLDELAAVTPNDPRIPGLRAALRK